MHEESKRWFKLAAGLDWDHLTRTPTSQEVVNQALKQTQTRFPLRVLGLASDGRVTLAEEERTHTHVIGLPGGGKSKFLELLIRGDIDNLVAGRSKAGLCLIDSSDFGNTYYKVLKYCATVGYDKVCLIDPNDLFRPEFAKVPTLNPIHYTAPVDVVVGNVLEIMRILWDGEDFSRTAKIQEYLQALVSILHETKGTLYDSKYFTSRTNDLYTRKRQAIMGKVGYSQFNDAYTTIDEAFRFNQNLFINDYGSTIRRLRPIYSKTLQLIVASNTNPLNFQKMISEGWVILCNLDPQVWDVPQQRFLGTLIINEIITAAYRLRSSDRNIPFYMYIDEVGRYATRTLSDVMNYKRTSRIQLIMAHQDFSQIKHAEVLAAVRNARIKVMFYVERDDRDKIVRQMYGGAVPLEGASYELSNLQKQEAVIKIGNQNPRRTRLVDLPDITDREVTPQQLQAFKTKLYQQPWYKSRQEIYQEINARFSTPQSTFSRTRRPSGKSAVGAAGEPKGKGKDTKGADVREVSDSPTDRPPVLPDTKRRSTRKIILD